MQERSTEPVVRHAFLAMGTRFEFVAPCAGGRDTSLILAAFEEAAAEVLRLHARYSYFDPASFLSHINREASQRAVPLDDESWEILATCHVVWRDSGGAFDPTIAPLMHRWGLRGSVAGTSPLRGDPSLASLPSLDASNVANLTWGMRHIPLDPSARSIRFLHPGISLDLGSIAKGHALDVAASCLRENGIASALLHGGTSTVVAIGSPPDSDAWRVQVGPLDNAPIVPLRDASLSVSAPHGRTGVDAEGNEVGHVIDPRSGRPASAFACAGVVHTSARASDAWSTALLVSGELPAIAKGHGWVAQGVGDRVQWCNA